MDSWRKETIWESFGRVRNGTWFQAMSSMYYYPSPSPGLLSCSHQESRTSIPKLMQHAILFSTFSAFSSLFTTSLNFFRKDKPSWLIKETRGLNNRRRMSSKWPTKEIFQDCRNKLKLQRKNKNPQEVNQKAHFLKKNLKGQSRTRSKFNQFKRKRMRDTHRSPKIKIKQQKRKIKQGKKQNKSFKKMKKKLQVIPLVPLKDNQNGRHLQLKSIAMKMRKNLSQKSP